MKESRKTLTDSISIKGTEENIESLTNKVIALAQQIHHSYEKARVGIYEALRNAWQHAHKKTDKEIRVDYTITENKLVMAVIDQGQGFDHNYVRRIIEERNRLKLSKSFYDLSGQNNGGLGYGTILMNIYLDKIEYEKNGSKVVLTKYPNSN